MGIPFEQILAEFSPNDRAEIERRTDKLIQEYKTLRQLRQTLGKTQAELAARLNKPQAASRYLAA